MKPIYMACLLLLAITLGLALLGLLLARIHKIHVHSAPVFCRTGTLLVLLAAYGLQHYGPAGSQLRALDFWSLMVIFGIGCYALLWAAIAYQLNQSRQHGFEESEMLSMLYADSQHPGFEATVEQTSRPHAGPR